MHDFWISSHLAWACVYPVWCTIGCVRAFVSMVCAWVCWDVCIWHRVHLIRAYVYIYNLSLLHPFYNAVCVWISPCMCVRAFVSVTPVRWFRAVVLTIYWTGGPHSQVSELLHCCFGDSRPFSWTAWIPTIKQYVVR